MAEKRLPNDLSKAVAFWLPGHDELVGGVVESPYDRYWLVDGLQKAGFEVETADTDAIKKYNGLKRSGDEAGARQLVHLLRLGILPTGTILPPEHGAHVIWPESACHLYAAAQVTPWPLRTSWRANGRVKITSNPIKRLTALDVDHMGLSADVALAVQSKLSVVSTLGAQIELLEKRLQEKLGARPEYVLLTSVPGIGRILAAIIPLATGAIERFDAVGNARR